MLQNVHTVSFSRPGFVELSPMEFDVSSEITLSFSTKNENGIILYGRGEVTTMTHHIQSTQNIQNQNHFQKPSRKRRQTGEVREDKTVRQLEKYIHRELWTEMETKM